MIRDLRIERPCGCDFHILRAGGQLTTNGDYGRSEKIIGRMPSRERKGYSDYFSSTLYGLFIVGYDTLKVHVLLWFGGIVIFRIVLYDLEPRIMLCLYLSSSNPLLYLVDLNPLGILNDLLILKPLSTRH